MHHRDICSCGTVISQCRCPGPKVERVLPRGCPACRAADAAKDKESK